MDARSVGTAILSVSLLISCNARTNDAAPLPGTVPAIPIDLPKAAAFDRNHFVFAVEMDTRGDLFVDGRRVTDDELRALAQAAHAHTPDVRALIRADRNVPWGRLVHVLDLLKMSGIAQFAFGIEAAPMPPPVATASASPPLSPLLAPPPPAPDTDDAPPAKARPKSGSWSCPFPKEADATGIDSADVVVIVTVAADGQPTGARIVGEALPGFGPAALRCALSQDYERPAERGARARGETPPIKVRFRR